MDFPNVCLEKAAELERHKLKKGDILFARRGIQATGLSAYVDSDHVGSLCGTGAILLRVDGKQVHPRFLAAYLATEEAFHWLRTHAVGAVMPNLNTEIISELSVPLPSFRIQIEIGKFVASLDDRIDLLRQTNATLEAIAQALFKSWFVDFDPVRAKAEGREPEVAAQGSASDAGGRMPGAPMDAATAALFPSEFEESELGLIPKGWCIARLSDLVELAYGRALKASDRVAGEVPVYGSGGITGWHDVALVKCPTIIVGRKGSVGTIYWEDRPCHPIDTVFFVRPKEAPLTLCLQVLRSLGLDKMNTDAAVPGLNRENAYRLEVVVAPAAVRDAWDKVVAPIYAAISNNNRCYEVLAKLRDTLLPRLISGKLRLPEAEGEVEAVA
ncbi:restriction endonuclease subunit S [Frateuria hangzhouensis]|uniref:restriction endonuclease subunit S n=1 Tax=Frateuria hangzhouensis TaxID=2995589 RepID=UPI002260C99D|nr:restriction endonuclease subunit S [Frateuria sp. STR12]MCX7514997.1 restriction endonuclease subunit S [Frateuria sp. STR12]